MKKTLLICLVLLFMVPVNANAFSWGDFFRALFGITTTTSVETLKEDVSSTCKDVQKSLITVEAKTQETFLALAKPLSSDKDYKTITTNLSSANAKTKENEKVEAINQVYSDFTSYLKNNKLEMVLIMKTMTDAEKTTFVKNTNILSEQSQKYYELKDKLRIATSKSSRKTYDDAEINNILANANALTIQLDNKAKAVGSLAKKIKLFGAVSGLKF